MHIFREEGSRARASLRNFVDLRVEIESLLYFFVCRDTHAQMTEEMRIELFFQALSLLNHVHK